MKLSGAVFYPTINNGLITFTNNNIKISTLAHNPHNINNFTWHYDDTITTNIGVIKNTELCVENHKIAIIANQNKLILVNKLCEQNKNVDLTINQHFYYAPYQIKVFDNIVTIQEANSIIFYYNPYTDNSKINNLLFCFYQVQLEHSGKLFIIQNNKHKQIVQCYKNKLRVNYLHNEYILNLLYNISSKYYKLSINDKHLTILNNQMKLLQQYKVLADRVINSSNIVTQIEEFFNTVLV